MHTHLILASRQGGADRSSMVKLQKSFIYIYIQISLLFDLGEGICGKLYISGWGQVQGKFYHYLYPTPHPLRIGQNLPQDRVGSGSRWGEVNCHPSMSYDDASMIVSVKENKK